MSNSKIEIGSLVMLDKKHGDVLKQVGLVLKIENGPGSFNGHIYHIYWFTKKEVLWWGGLEQDFELVVP